MRKLFVILLIIIILLTTVSTIFANTRQTPTGIPINEIGNRVDELVANYMHEFTPGLAVVVVHDGEIVFSQGYGYTDLGREMPIDSATTIFEHGSINKLFIWTSVMQLVEQGLIDLDNDIHEYISEETASLFNFEKSFTMRDLLNHSAGFGEFAFNLFLDGDQKDGATMTLLEALLITQPQQIFEPGTASSYSNFGSALAAYVVTQVSEMGFADFEQTNIFGPLGMTSTRNQPHWLGDSAYIQNKARGHQPDGRGGFVENPWSYIPIYPGGASRGTAEDLAQFAIALMPPQGESGPLFNSRNTLDLMLSPSCTNPQVMRGLSHGFLTYDGVLPGIGHGGGTIGFNTDFVMIPEERFGIVVFSNAVGGSVFISQILDEVLGNSWDTVPSYEGNLPDTRDVAGEFVMLRRAHGDIMEPLNALVLGTNAQVNAIDENTITLTIMGETVTYRQVEAYVFRVVSADTPTAQFLARMVYEIHFVMEDGQPVRILTGNGFDATRASFAQSMLVSLLNIAIWLLIALYFIVMSIIILVKALRKKGSEANTFTRLSNGLILCGLLFVVNEIVLTLRIVVSMPFISSGTVTPHIWVNWILIVLSAVLFVLSMVFLKKCDVTTKRKVLYFITVALLAVLTFIMWSGNFFVMM